MTASSYADPVDVQRRDGSPVAFCWRGRVYRVQGVLAHWLETGPWWQSASVRALLTTGVPSHHPTTSARPSASAASAAGPQGQSTAAAASADRPAAQPESAASSGHSATGSRPDGPQGQVAASAPGRREGAGGDQDQREFWQVEAAAGRHGTPGVFELCADLTAETPTWSVTTVTDEPTPPDRDSP